MSMERYGTVPYARQTAASLIREALKKLETNPHLAGLKPPGPYETRPIYRFTIEVEGITSALQVAFVYGEDENHIILL